MTHQVVKFLPSSSYVEKHVEPPVPTKLSIPQWYKDYPRPELIFDKNENSPVTNLKSCVPFLDSFTMGYVQRTWSEITVEAQEEGIVFATRNTEPFFTKRETSSVPIPEEFYPAEFVWRTPWTAKLPKGYSLLVTHPFNRNDLPFRTLTGIIDSDNFYHTLHGNKPFWIKKSFTGIIPVGTPMYQLIPFKRDSWKSEIEKYDEDYRRGLSLKLIQVIYNSYRKQFWTKKDFT